MGQITENDNQARYSMDEKKSIRAIAECWRVPKSTEWNVLKNKQTTAELLNHQQSDCPQRASESDDGMIVRVVKKV